MKRIQSLDLARGFTVLLMPSIHVVMLSSQLSVQQSLLGDILGFIAEGPGAQLFMLLMGVNFTFSSRISSKRVLQRALKLLIAAYLLNSFKFIIPLTFKILPANLLEELQLSNDLSSAPFFFFLGDILHFTTIAYIALFIIYKLKHYYIWSFILAIIIMILSPVVWDFQTGNVPLDRIIGYFNGHPPNTFFPVFPWLVYPFMGLTLGFCLKRFKTNTVLRKAGITGIAFIVISTTLPSTLPNGDWLPFYRTQPADTLFHLGFVLVWLALFHLLFRKIPVNPFFKLLGFCSRYITSIYFIQWVLICWCLVFTGYLKLYWLQSFAWMTGITISTLVLTKLYTSLNTSSVKSLPFGERFREKP